MGGATAEAETLEASLKRILKALSIKLGFEIQAGELC